MVKLLATVYDAYNRAVTPDQPWYPRDGVTFCNLAVNLVCNAFDYTKFNAGSVSTPVVANAMVSFIQKSTDWLMIDGNVAQAHANGGALVVAGQINPAGHGHICVVIPGEMQTSGHLGKDVPVVMNVGKDVFIGKHVGFAFTDEPLYFVLCSTITK